MTQEILNRLAKIEKRLTALEKDSHPPVDLSRPIYQEMARILGDAAAEAGRNAE